MDLRGSIHRIRNQKIEVVYGIKVARTQKCIHTLRKHLWHRNPQKLSGYRLPWR